MNCNIGCSEYKIDIGIVDPENPDSYLLGILADGENCKNSATSKDRFVLQPDVLAGLGWKIMRVWTLDWLDDSARVIERLNQKLKMRFRAKIPSKNFRAKQNSKFRI